MGYDEILLAFQVSMDVVKRVWAWHLNRQVRQHLSRAKIAPEIGLHDRTRALDHCQLTEFDPSLDKTDLSALTAARWVGEILAGSEAR